MADNFGVRIGVEGEKEFKKALADINSQMKVLGSEMKLVESSFDSQDKSVEALTARNNVLNKNIDAQKSKIETLRSALQNASSSFGENDRRTQAWATQLNNAQAELNKMERELHENNQALEDSKKEFNNAGKAADDMGEEVKDAGKDADKASGHFEALGGVCKAAAATIAVAFAAVSAAAISAGKALIDMSREGAQYADTVLTESVVTGIATDKLQEYMYAAELVDVSTETLTKSMAKQIKSMKSAKDGSKSMVEAYEKLGVSVTDANGDLRNSDDVYWELIDALGKVENETERDALAMTILGKSAQELNPLITAGAERMNELGEEARKAGYVVSDEMLSAYGQLDDQVQKLTLGTKAAKNALGTILLPVLTQLAGEGVDLLGEFTNGILGANGDLSKMGEVISGILPKALDSIMQYVPVILDLIKTLLMSVGKAIVDNLPMIVSSAVEIVKAILEGLISALPQIADGALMLVMELVNVILDNLSMLVDTAIQVVVTLAEGISKALPKLIPAIVSVVVQVCKVIIDNLPKILKAALELVKGLAQGILDAIPVLISALPSLIKSIIDFILDAIPMIIDTGIQLLTSLVSALPVIISSIVSALPQIIDNIISGILGAIPLLIDAGIQLLTSLIQNLPVIITTILTAIPQIISSVLDAIIGNIPLIVQAGIQLLTSLITNLPTIIVEICKAMPQIISGIVSSLGQGVGQVAEVGKNLVKGLWNGIQSLASWIWDKVSSWASNLWNGIKDFFGIHSPSKKFAEIGRFMSMGLGIGFVDEMEKVDKDIQNSLPTDFDIDARANIHGIANDSLLSSPVHSMATALGASGTPITISVPLYLDGKEISKATSEIQYEKNASLMRALGVT